MLFIYSSLLPDGRPSAPLSAGAPFQRVGRFFASHCERKWFDRTDSIARCGHISWETGCLQGANPWTIHCHAELLRILPGTTLRQSPNWSMTPLDRKSTRLNSSHLG